MKINEAFNLLAQVCEMYKGTGPEHDSLREALKTVSDKCAETAGSKKKVPKEKKENKK